MKVGRAGEVNWQKSRGCESEWFVWWYGMWSAKGIDTVGKKGILYVIHCP